MRWADGVPVAWSTKWLRCEGDDGAGWGDLGGVGGRSRKCTGRSRSRRIAGYTARLRRFFAFLGPAYLVSVGYMDPGNWATDLQGGARFGYALIWVLLMSNLMAILLQTLAARLGVVTGHDLAQACRAEYSRALNAVLWVLAEVAIAACDLAEILGTVIALKLLFGIPLLVGLSADCVRHVFDSLLAAMGNAAGRGRHSGAGRDDRRVFRDPDLSGEAGRGRSDCLGLRPSLPPGSLYIAIGILGATVMPHNLYLHSALVQTRRIGADADEQVVRMPVLSARCGDCAQRCVFRQRRDPDRECGGVLAPRAGCHEHRRSPQASALVPGQGRADPVWHRPVVCGPELDADRHAGGPDRDGGVLEPADGAVAAPADHAADRPGCPRSS